MAKEKFNLKELEKSVFWQNVKALVIGDFVYTKEDYLKYIHEKYEVIE